jgi:hypothetical protein
MFLFEREFDEFLCASIVEEKNGMALSVMSAFARRNVDPWREAARLSQLPRDIATRELCAMIAEFPHGSPSRASPQAIAERLMAPLPRYASSAASPRKTPPGRVALSRRETVRSPVVLLFSWSRRRSWRSACNRRLSIPSCQRRSLRPCGGSSWARGFWRGVRIALSFGRCARDLPLKIEAHLDQLRLGGGKGGFRSLQGVLLGREIEPGDNLARLYQVANMDGPLDDASVEAKGEAHPVLGTNLACQRCDLVFRATMDGDGPNGAGLRRRRRRLVAARDGRRDQGCCCNSRLKHWRRLS